MYANDLKLRGYNMETEIIFQVRTVEMDGWARGVTKEGVYQDIFFKQYGENKPNGYLLRATGSSDKHGREIYEGDLILETADNRLYRVDYDPESASFGFRDIYENWVDFLDIFEEDMEIVGRYYRDGWLEPGSD